MWIIEYAGYALLAIVGIGIGAPLLYVAWLSIAGKPFN